MLRDGAKLADATQRVVMFFPREGMPIDVSDARVQRARATRTAGATGAREQNDPTSRTSVTVRGRILDVACSLKGTLLPEELAELVNEHLASAAWDSVETAFRKPLRVSGAPPRESVSGRVAEVFGARVAINCGGDLRAASRSESQAELFKAGPTSMECEIGMGFMSTWTVHAEFYSHGELFCLVFGQCMPDWTMEDTWWGQGDIVVDESTMSWEEWIGYEPPETPVALCYPPTGNLPPDTLLKCNRNRTAWEDSAIVNARANYRRTNFGTDTVSARECADLNDWLTEALADVVNGKQTFSTGVDDTGDKPHWGLVTTGAGHLDPRTYLAIQNNSGSDVAWRQLMSTLLHEAAHWHGAPGHPNYQSGSSTYTDPLYKRLMPANLNSDTCLK